MRVYVAGPIDGSGDRGENVRRACFVGAAILDTGHIPFVPHTNVLWDTHYPRTGEEWLAWDFAWLDRCDSLVRLPGVSPGSDREVARAHDRGLPVYLLRDLTADLEEFCSALSQLPCAPATLAWLARARGLYAHDCDRLFERHAEAEGYVGRHVDGDLRFEIVPLVAGDRCASCTRSQPGSCAPPHSA